MDDPPSAEEDELDLQWFHGQLQQDRELHELEGLEAIMQEDLVEQAEAADAAEEEEAEAEARRLEAEQAEISAAEEAAASAMHAEVERFFARENAARCHSEAAVDRLRQEAEAVLHGIAAAVPRAQSRPVAKRWVKRRLDKQQLQSQTSPQVCLVSQCHGGEVFLLGCILVAMICLERNLQIEMKFVFSDNYKVFQTS